MQEWKARINGFFQPKSQAERQKMMKYLIVMPAAILCGAVILWLLYTSLNKSDERVGDAFNTEIPEGENDGMKDKMSEYEAAEADKEKEARQQTVAVLDTLTAVTPQDSGVRQPSAVETSAQAYQREFGIRKALTAGMQRDTDYQAIRPGRLIFLPVQFIARGRAARLTQAPRNRN